MRIQDVEGWDDENEEITVVLDNGAKLIISRENLQAITNAMYQTGEPMRFDRPAGVYVVDKWLVMPAGKSILLGFVTSDGQTANFEMPTNATESQVEHAAMAIQSTMRDLLARRQ